MNKTDARDFAIALSLLPFVTPARIRLLRENFESFDSMCSASSKLLAALFSIGEDEARVMRDPLSLSGVRRQLEPLRDSVVTIEDDEYPPLLRETCDPPLALHCRGNRALLQQPSVAVVGSRKASAYGVNAAMRFARELAERGIVVVSGIARGIDAAAHAAAVEKDGLTIAVIGTGIDIIYPRSNRMLAERVARDALIISEFPPGTPPRAANFPIRNRVIAGITRGTVIVEATGRSGSLITARLAAEQGREVFAVPGPIFSAASEGPNRLIQYGAKLVQTVDDIIEELGPDIASRAASPAVRGEDLGELQAVADALSLADARHIDEVATRVGRPVGEVSAALVQLELRGVARTVPGGRYVKNA